MPRPIGYRYCIQVRDMLLWGIPHPHNLGRVFRPRVSLHKDNMDTIPALSIGPFVATKLGLQIDGDVPFTDWEAYGRGLLVVHESIHFLIGDWLNYGERHYGETYLQALEETPFAESTLRSDKWVAEKVKASHRLTELSWSHHREVAILPPEQQRPMLERALENQWTRLELRDVIRDNGHVTSFDRSWDSLLNQARKLCGEANRAEDIDRLRAVVLLLEAGHADRMAESGRTVVERDTADQPGYQSRGQESRLPALPVMGAWRQVLSV